MHFVFYILRSNGFNIIFNFVGKYILNKSNCVNTTTTTSLSSFQMMRLCFFFSMFGFAFGFWHLFNVPYTVHSFNSQYLAVYLYLYNIVNAESDPKCVNNKIGKRKLFFYKSVNEVLGNLNSGVCKISRSEN